MAQIRNLSFVSSQEECTISCGWDRHFGREHATTANSCRPIRINSGTSGQFSRHPAVLTLEWLDLSLTLSFARGRKDNWTKAVIVREEATFDSQSRDRVCIIR
jgi:hypothetical protein